MSGRGKTQRNLKLGSLSFTSKAPKQLTQKQLVKNIAENPFLSRVAKTNPLQAEIFARQQTVRKENINAVVHRLKNAGATELAESIRKGPNSAALDMFNKSPPVTTVSPYTFIHSPKPQNNSENYNVYSLISGPHNPRKGGKRHRKTRRHSKSR